jgi:hypothetical protein
MKLCKKCNIEKSLTGFYVHKGYKDGYRNICKDCFKQEKNLYLKKNPNKHCKYMITYNKKNKYTELKYNSNSIYRSICLLRNRLNNSLKVKKWQKNTHFSKYIGCSKEELKKHLESQFQEGMNWENQGKWHMDHIIPLSSAKTEQELYKLCHYTNLQPLWAKDNLSKGNKI